MAYKKSIEADERLLKIIREVYSDYEKYLPTLQDKRMYQRKQAEYETLIQERIKEGLTDD